MRHFSRFKTKRLKLILGVISLTSYIRDGFGSVFLNYKIKSARYCVKRGEGYSFCGESEQHPKWDSFVKGA